MGQAVGIPQTTEFGNVNALKPGRIYDLSIQRHKADQAGEHIDFRIGDPEIQLLSWAIPKAKLPEPNERLLAVQQPLHEYDYGTFEGRIEEGYGKGDVKLEKYGKVLVTDIGPNKIHLTIISDRYPTRLTLFRPNNFKDKDWLILNNTPNKPIDYEKIHMKQIGEDKLKDFLEQHSSESIFASPKIDGAHVIILIKDGKLEVFSYRISKVHGGNILHTERLFTIRPKVKIPERLNNTILKGELYAVRRKGDVEEILPVNELSGLLNSSIYKTYQDAARKNVRFKIGLFDIYKHGDMIIDPEAVDYKERLRLVREFLPQLDKNIFHVIEPVEGVEQIIKLWDIVKNGKHPLTTEGIVLYPSKGYPIKLKTLQERDVYIREILPGQGKYKGNAAGGFTYSLEPNGPIIGHVGTGFSDELRREMWEDPDEFIGRRARVKFLEQLPSGALRAPVFLALHEDYPNHKEAGLDFDDPLWFKVLDYLQDLRLQVGLAKIAELDPREFVLTEARAPAWLTQRREISPMSLTQRVEWIFGGPNALTNLLLWSAIGAAVGNLLGYGAEKAFKESFRGSRGRLALLGAILGAFPAAVLNLAPALTERGLSGALRPTPLQTLLEERAIKKSGEFLKHAAEDMFQLKIEINEQERECIKTAYDKLNTNINVDRWGEIIMRDPYLDSWEKTMSVSIPLVTSIVSEREPYVTVQDVARTAYNMGLGSLFGSILGNIAAKVIGLTPEAQKKIQRSGELAGLLKSILNPVKEVRISYGPNS